jgi:hypothetical protein
MTKLEELKDAADGHLFMRLVYDAYDDAYDDAYTAYTAYVAAYKDELKKQKENTND